MTQKLKVLLGRVENIMRKGENAVHHHFSPFSTMFSKCLFYWVFKSCDKELTLYITVKHILMHQQQHLNTLWEKEKLLVLFPITFSTQSDNCIPIDPKF